MIAVALGLLATASTFALVWALAGPMSRSALRKRVAVHVDPAVERERADARRRGRELMAALLDETERRLGRRPAWGVLERRVQQSGLTLRPVELAYGTLAAALLGGFLLTLATGSAAALLMAPLLAAAAVWAFLGVRAGRRRRAFDDQLPDLLLTLAAALRAGHSFAQALQTAADDVEEPARRELGLVLAEVRLGRSLDEALEGMAERINSRDLEFVLTSVAIQRQVGGSLAELLDVVIETVRRRQQFVRKLRSLTATGRMSAYVLIALPPALALGLTLMNGDYMAPLWETATGRLLVATSVTMTVIGALTLRRIVTPRFEP